MALRIRRCDSQWGGSGSDTDERRNERMHTAMGEKQFPNRTGRLNRTMTSQMGNIVKMATIRHGLMCCQVGVGFSLRMDAALFNARNHLTFTLLNTVESRCLSVPQ